MRKASTHASVSHLPRQIRPARPSPGADAPAARMLYNTACAELAVLLKKSSSARTLPATLNTPAGPYVLEFDNARNPGRWEPYFTELLTPAELRSKSFVVENSRLRDMAACLSECHPPPYPGNVASPNRGVRASHGRA